MRATTGSWVWDHAGPDGHKCPEYFKKMTLQQCLDLTESNIKSFDGIADGRIKCFATIEGVGTCSDDLMLGAKELADKYGTFTLMHKASSREEVASELKATGHRPVEHMYRIGALGPNVYLNHMTAVEAFEVEMLAETDTKVCQNPPAALKLAKGTTQMSRFLEMRAKGVTVCLGCDGVNSGDHKDMFRSMYLAATLPKDAKIDPEVITAEEVIEMATLAGYRAIGWERRARLARGRQEGRSHSHQCRPAGMGAHLQLRVQPRLHRERRQRRHHHRRRQDPHGEPPAHHHRSRGGARAAAAPWRRSSRRGPTSSRRRAGRSYDAVKGSCRSLATRPRHGSSSTMVTQPTRWIGQSVTRLEDPPLVTGRGRYAGDISFPHQLHMRVVRSHVASGRIVAIDTGAAKALPGVFAVWSAADIPDAPPIDFREGRIEKLEPYRQPVLATDRVRYVGDPIAAVFAEDPYIAEDAADLVTVDIEELPVLLHAQAEPGEFSPGRSTEAAIVRQGYGDLDAAFRAAHAIVELELSVGRHSGVPIETRGAIGCYDAARDMLELHGAAKIPHANRNLLARMLKRAPSAISLHEFPCRRRFRRPRRALPGGRAGLDRCDAARPTGEMDRGSSRASDVRRPFAPANPQAQGRGRPRRTHPRDRR